MRVKKLILTVLILFSVLIYGYSAIHINKGRTYSIAIDLSQPFSIDIPAEISIVGNDGERGLRIGPNIGRGWRGEAGGQATYKFYIPETGQYILWGYCLWFDECTNAIFAKFDDSNKAIVGNDPIYKKWHWVRGFKTNLRKGTHTLVLSNHSDHISMQEILLTNSASVTPGNCSLTFSDIFYDGFDGCDEGNFKSWKQISGQWLVQNREQPASAGLVENVLIGKCKKKAFIIYQDSSWERYSLHLAVKSISLLDTNGTISICFGLTDLNQYYHVKFQPSEVKNEANVQICRTEAHRQIVLANFRVPWQDDIWHYLDISLNANSIGVRIDDTKPLQIPKNRLIQGGVGLLLEGEVTAYFDDIHVSKISESEI